MQKDVMRVASGLVICSSQGEERIKRQLRSGGVLSMGLAADALRRYWPIKFVGLDFHSMRLTERELDFRCEKDGEMFDRLVLPGRKCLHQTSLS